LGSEIKQFRTITLGRVIRYLKKNNLIIKPKTKPVIYKK